MCRAKLWYTMKRVQKRKKKKSTKSEKERAIEGMRKSSEALRQLEEAGYLYPQLPHPIPSPPTKKRQAAVYSNALQLTLVQVSCAMQLSSAVLNI